MKNSNYLLLVFITTCFFSCQPPTFNSVEEMQQYVANEENGFRKKKTNGDKVTTLQYQPIDLVVKKMFSSDNNNVDSIRESLSKYMYFNLSVSKSENGLLQSGGMVQYEKNVKSLSFGLGMSTFSITSEKDTLRMIDYNFARYYGLAKRNDFLFVFERPTSMKIEWIDFYFGGIINEKIRFDSDFLDNEPKLSFISLSSKVK